MKRALIEIQSYSFRIDGKEILKDVSLAVREGEYLSVIGPNGAGKTTLLKCLIRILTGGIGSIKVDGRPLEAYTQRELANLMSYVPQADGRALPFTVHEFVMMGRYPYLSPFSSVTKEDEEAVRRALALTGTTEFAERILATLSGGERQKVFIAAALAQGARILLLDEPTTFLDYRHQSEIQGILKRVNRERGVTMVAVTHDLNNAVLWGERVLALKGGAVAFCGPAEEVMSNAILEDLYGMSFQFSEHPRSRRPFVVPEVVE